MKGIILFAIQDHVLHPCHVKLCPHSWVVSPPGKQSHHQGYGEDGQSQIRKRLECRRLKPLEGEVEGEHEEYPGEHHCSNFEIPYCSLHVKATGLQE